MNPKVKAFFLGALEAAGAGMVLGVGSVWIGPSDVLFTKAGLIAAVNTGAQVAVIYLIGYLRKHVAFRETWTDEERAAKKPTV